MTYLEKLQKESFVAETAYQASIRLCIELRDVAIKTGTEKDRRTSFEADILHEDLKKRHFELKDAYEKALSESWFLAKEAIAKGVTGMYMLNGEVELNGVKFWRVDNLRKPRVGLDMMKKPMMLLLKEDFTLEAATTLVNVLNERE